MKVHQISKTRAKTMDPLQKLFKKYTTSSFDHSQDVAVLRDYLLTRYVSDHAPELPKNNQIAGAKLAEGLELFRAKNYTQAMEKCNECLCWAEAGSEALTYGYANRSAVYFEQGEFQYALLNIEIARQYGLPENCPSLLETRARECRAKLAASPTKHSPREINCEANPRIPFLAKGIHVEDIPKCGRGLVAERCFTTGDVILAEKPLLASVEKVAQYRNCNHCSTPILPNLTPCRNCTEVLYCSDRCLRNDEPFHIFECGISKKLKQFASYGMDLGPKMLFYGLSLFNWNLEKFIAFCAAHPRTGSDPTELNYTALDPLQEFKMFHTAYAPSAGSNYEARIKLATALFYVIYIKHPPVAAIFATQHHQDFLLYCMLDYMRMTCILRIGRTTPHDAHTSQLFTIASLCNHACYPNTLALYHAGQLKLVVLRRIQPGEQITLSYVDPSSDDAAGCLKRSYIDRCLCEGCDPANAFLWRLSELSASGADAGREMMTVMGTLQKWAHDLKHPFVRSVLQRFCQRHLPRYASGGLDGMSAIVFRSYKLSLAMTFLAEVEAQMRMKIPAGDGH